METVSNLQSEALSAAIFRTGAAVRGIRQLATTTGLTIPPTEESGLIGGEGCVGQVLRRQLALCPVCSQSAYHSFLFQIPFLHVCPIHNVPLAMHCLSCGAPTPKYEFTPQLFQSDWGCAHCHAPIAGQAPDLLELLDFREQAEALKRVFGPLARWMERVNRCGAGFERMALCPHAPDRYARALLEGAICALRPPPTPATSPHFKVVCLNWHLRLRPPHPQARIEKAEPEQRPYGGISNAPNWVGWRIISPSPPRRREPFARRKSAAALVYESTIWRIQQWLLERHGKLGLATDLDAQPRFEQDRLITEGWDVYELSYLLLRLWYEGGMVTHWTVAGGPINGCKFVLPWFAVMGDRVLRIPFRAAILASYGTVVCTVSASKLAGNFLTLPPRESMERMLAHACQTDFLRHTGVVLMPATEDLMTWFPEMRSKLDENWSVRWKQISELPSFERLGHDDFQPAKRPPLP